MKMKTTLKIAAIRGANRLFQPFAPRKRSLQASRTQIHSRAPWIIALTAMALATPAFAANWQIGAGGSPAETLWSNPANWSTGVVPGEGATIGENVTFPIFAASKTVDIGETNYSVGVFQISATASADAFYNGTGTITASALNIGTNSGNNQPDRQTFNANLVISGNILVQRKNASHVFNGSLSAGGLNFGQNTNTFNGPVTMTGANGLEVFYNSIFLGLGPTYVFNNTITSANGGSVSSSNAGLPATLKAGNADTLSGISGTLSINAGGILNITTAQNSFPTIAVKSSGLLRGDLTNATYGAGGKIGIHDNAVLAIAAGPEPTEADLGLVGGVKDALAFYGILDDGTFAIGDDGDSIYKGMAFGGFTLGDYQGKTLRAPTGAGNLALAWLGGAPTAQIGSMDLESLDQTGVADITAYVQLNFNGGVINGAGNADSVTTFNVVGAGADNAALATFSNNFTIKADQTFNFSGSGYTIIDPSSMKGSVTYSGRTMLQATTEVFANKSTAGYENTMLTFNDGTALAVSSTDTLVLETMDPSQIALSGSPIVLLDSTGITYSFTAGTTPNLLALMQQCNVELRENNNNTSTLNGDGIVIGDGFYFLSSNTKGTLHVITADTGMISAAGGGGTTLGIGARTGYGMKLSLPVDGNGATLLINSTDVIPVVLDSNARVNSNLAGTVTLNGPITDTPGIETLAGTIILDASVTVPAGVALTVHTGSTANINTAISVSTLAGGGTVNSASNLTFDTVAPGGSVGSLNLGSFAMPVDATYKCEIGGDGGGTPVAGTDNDVINAGTMTINGTWKLHLVNTGIAAGSMAGTEVFTIVNGNSVVNFLDTNVTITASGFDLSGASITESGGDITITGLQSTGTGGSGYGTWAATNAGGEEANQDFDKDGVRNGIEFFMNSPAGFTSNPGLVGNTVTWTNGGNIPATDYGTQFVVQISTDLVKWTNVEGSDPNLSNTAGSVAYTRSGAGTSFARLKVTPN